MILLLLIAILVVSIFILRARRRDPRLPPGIYGWPLVGKIPSFSRSLQDQIQEFRKQFGDIFIWQIGARNVVFLCDPHIIRQALMNPVISDRPSEYFTFDSWSNYKKSGIVNNNGLSWQAHRRFALRNLRDSGFGTSLVENIVCMEAECLIKDFKENFLLTPTEIPSAVNVATLNCIWKLVADIRFDRDDEDLKSFLDTMTKLFTKLQGPLNFFDVYPMLVPLTPKFVKDKMGLEELQGIREDIKNYLRSVVARRKATLNKENPNGLIDSYLLEMDQDTNDKHFDEESLILSLGDLFFAGSDTTASTLRWVMQLMAFYPEIQKKVQAEIDSVVPRDRLPRLDDKSRLPFTEATLNEALRVSHLAILSLFHGANDDTMIEQYFIPKGTVIAPFLYGCHMDPKYWDKPNTFNPAHFLDSKGNFTPNTDFFIPFSAGRRKCLGEGLARSELFLFGTSLIQNLCFELPEESKDSSLEMTSGSIIFGIPPNNKIVIKDRNVKQGQL